MGKLFLSILLAVICLFAVGCGAEKQNTSTTPKATDVTSATKYSQISQEQAKNIMDTENEIIVLDVRTKAEYDSGHIKNAILLPNEDIGVQPPSELPNKSQKILVYCRSGNRSKQAAQKLANMGYTNIYEFGGINSWKYEIEK